MSVEQSPITFGFIPANRGFFSAELAAKMRKQTIAAMKKLGVTVVVPTEKQTKVGCVEDRAEAKLCAELFRKRRVHGIVVGAVNFGDEQAVAMVVRQAALDVPIFIFGCQEEETLTRKTDRRDSFCGLLSIADALRQIGAPYSIGRRPICYPSDDSFRSDLDWFVRICRVVNGVRGARYGQIGTRPEGFWTCRYDERSLELLGPTVVVADLSEAIAEAKAIKDGDRDVKRLVKDIGEYADTSRVKDDAVLRMAKFELYLRRFRDEHEIDAFAVQCWSSIQQNYGICACSTLSRLGDDGIPSACEVDVLGAMSMHACQLASGSPSGLADWNNLHNEDDELVNIWHCGVFPKSFAKTRPRLGTNHILCNAGACTREQGQGICEFVAKPSPLTLFRVAQDAGEPFKAIVAQGAFEDNAAETFGGYGWCRIENLQRLYRDVLLNHSPHHVAITQSHVGNALWEAFGKYLGFGVYGATQATPGLYTPELPFD